MAGHDDKRSRDLLNLTGGGDTVAWAALPSYAVPAHVRDRLSVGVSFVPAPGGGEYCYAKHLDGTVIQVIASTDAPRADYEVAARRLLDEAVADRAAAEERARHTHEQAVIAAERDRQRQRIEEIEARLEAGGSDAVSLDELREVTLYRRGPERLAELQQEARARTQTPTAVNPMPSEDAGENEEK